MMNLPKTLEGYCLKKQCTSFEVGIPLVQVASGTDGLRKLTLVEHSQEVEVSLVVRISAGPHWKFVIGVIEMLMKTGELRN